MNACLLVQRGSFSSKDFSWQLETRTSVKGNDRVCVGSESDFNCLLGKYSHDLVHAMEAPTRARLTVTPPP